MTRENAWDDHVGAALLGTGRRTPAPLPEAPEPDGDAAGRLLDQAAVLAVGRRAGLLPHVPDDVEVLAPAPPEELPVVPAAAAQRLDGLLQAPGADPSRAEWLETAARLGLRVPPALLPAVLDLGRDGAGRPLRPVIARVAGRRGVWLALQNPRWAYLLGYTGDAPEADDIWQTGTRDQRAAHLENLRGTDPAAAREALLEVWESEPAPARAAFLATFATGLSLADAAFLEDALTDRGKDVRQHAADLLAALPGTAYGARMAERARDCLRREDDRLVTGKPDAHDDALARDGVPFQPGGTFLPGRNVGTRAGWLREILSRTPLATWPDHLGLPPERLVTLPVTDAADGPVAARRGGRSGADAEDAVHDVHVSWAQAALRQRDARWARALLAHGEASQRPEIFGELVTVLPPADRDGAAAVLARRLTDPALLCRVLHRVPGPWSGELAATVTAALAALAERPGNDDRRSFPGLCHLVETRLDPALAADAADRFADLPAPAQESRRDALVAVLRTRHAMIKELIP
ncbi:DUF5691 domain-containing protein [Actinomadura flavalba]|uniref:DUF5691 domain-containing protein n=1 Tax=Actinomadura flavalba TaxID=1120938 RepID=UPI0003662BAA|nr:DUF5691 domain-containing protein [Actinomadura flavalba]